MGKNITRYLALAGAAAIMTACSAAAEKHTGQAEGYGGTLTVSVSMNGSDITDVTVISHSETQGVGTRAIDALPDEIVRTDSVEVDNVSGATVTSEAIKEAVRQAMGNQGMSLNAAPMDGSATQAPSLRTEYLSGAGMAATGRIGPGKAEDGSQVYSVNVVFAGGVFDQEGRIQHIVVEQAELVSPNLGGGNMLSFPGGSEEEDAFLSAVSAFRGKRGMGEDYSLESGPWRDQMRIYEAAMTGKTVDEVLQWYESGFDKETGRPLQEGDSADAMTGATISLRGEYGDVLLAIQRAWEDAKSRMTTPPEGTRVDTNTPTDVTDEEASVG